MEEDNLRLIPKYFTKEQIKMLYFHALCPVFPDNNEKADIVKMIIGPEFEELGLGTNRIAFLYNGMVVIIALDRRGLIDNWQEFKRSIEAPQFFIKAYETNMLILIEEYVTLMDEREFRMNESGIKEILEELSKAYIFEDIGFTMKNYENWGYREDGDIVCLDLGYVYSLKGQEHLLSCPHCKASLKYNPNYTGFICQNKSCNKKYATEDIIRRMDLTQMDLENKTIASLNNVSIPNIDGFTVEFCSKFIGAFH